MRVGLVGAGWVTQYHLPAWANVDGAEVVAICDPDPIALGSRANAFGIAGRYPSLKDMLENIEIDALDIATPRRESDLTAWVNVIAGSVASCQFRNTLVT